MGTRRSRTPRTTASAISSRSEDDGFQDDVTSIHDFFRGEWTWLWPTWVLFLVMIAVIVWDRFAPV